MGWDTVLVMLVLSWLPSGQGNQQQEAISKTEAECQLAEAALLQLHAQDRLCKSLTLPHTLYMMEQVQYRLSTLITIAALGSHPTLNQPHTQYMAPNTN